MSLRRTLRGPPALLSRQKAKEAAKLAEARVEIIAGLKKTYENLDQDHADYLETQFLDSQSVKVESLNFKADGDYDMQSQPIFFQPMPRDKLIDHPINDESEETKEDLAVLEGCIEPNEGDDYLSRADFMCCTLGLELRLDLSGSESHLDQQNDFSSTNNIWIAKVVLFRMAI
ncbi:hypothetical protein VTN96DRAFT_6317 [Rasamsonia emersonii]